MNNSELIWKLVELLLDARQKDDNSTNVPQINEKKEKQKKD